MTQQLRARLSSGGMMAAAVLALAIAPVSVGAAPRQPESGTPPTAAPVPVAPVPVIVLPPAAGSDITGQPVPPPAPVPEPIMPWSLGDAEALLGVIAHIDEDGLIPADYLPGPLREAIDAGPGPELDEVASTSFAWLAEDLRDGRTPMPARVQWFAVDPDVDVTPTPALMARALDTHDVAGVLTGLAPTNRDYQALRAALAVTPAEAKTKRALIRANMDRWRWLPRDLGVLYLHTNVPEFQLRLATNDRIVRSYRTIVGKPGKTATPQLAEQVKAVVFNPTWTVPQSIVVGEGLGARLIRNPAAARREGYVVTRAGTDGLITVVQQPGPGNSLGLMKIDMPNPHAIYLHDTPSRKLFNAPVRAFSHGCIRTERAQELGMTMAILGADLTAEQAVQNALSGKYTKVPMTRTFPVYITYFTMAQDITGKLTAFNDIYDRDAPVLASFDQPRQPKTGQRISSEAIIKLDNPL